MYDVVVGGVAVDVASDTGVACLGAETAQGGTVGARLHDLMSAAKAAVSLPRRAQGEPLHVVVDATGIKVYGEGEWKVRSHGGAKQRRWQK